jgi:hypothetical protein
MRQTLLLAYLLIAIAAWGQSGKAVRGYVPANGFVPDETTAIKVAEAVLIPVYGAQQIADEQPFRAELRGDIWTVSGTIPCNKPATNPTPPVTPAPGIKRKDLYCEGGAALVRISKSDGKVLFMIHSK